MHEDFINRDDRGVCVGDVYDSLGILVQQGLEIQQCNFQVVGYSVVGYIG